MARIGVQEIRSERRADEVADAEAQQVAVERQRRLNIGDHEHGMAHAERAGAEAGDRAAGTEWFIGYLGAVECLETIAGRVGERDQGADETLVRESRGFARHRHTCAFQACGQRVECRGVGDLPAEIALSLGQGAVHHQALLAVVHAERAHAGATVHRLHAQPTGGVVRPVVKFVRADAEIAERLDRHGWVPPCRILSWRWLGQQ